MNAAAAAFPASPWRIGVDVGGTFTDMVLADAAGAIRVFKVPSVPANPGKGVVDAVHAAAAGCGVTAEALLAGCALFVHGSTVATNMVLEGKGAKVGMLTTPGFRDVIEVRRGIRFDQWDHRRPWPPVLVPRHLRLSVPGRIGAGGEELVPLDRAAVAEALDTLEAEGVDAIAICFMNSFLDPAHEEAAAAMARQRWGERLVCTSSAVVPILGEYERHATAVMNAYLAPRVVPYLAQLNETLMRLGLPRPILLVQSNGGAISLDHAAARPVNLVLSGPAAGVGALGLYGAVAGSRDMVSMEIGGTSCDVTLMSGGRVDVEDAFSIAEYHLAIPAVDIHTVGAGGGTIARVDSGGMLAVGPKGAGARPGPAAYGLGGSEPTVTDALLVLGRMRPGPYAGGSVTLDADLAHGAIAAKLGGPLLLSVEEAAIGMIRLLEQNLLHAVEAISIARGHDPRRFTLVACGGAGPMHGAAVGRKLGCKAVLVPRLAGAFCALGMLNSDVRQDHLQVFLADLDAVPPERVGEAYAALVARGEAGLAADGFTADKARIVKQIDLRYRAQQTSIRVDVAQFDPAAIRAAFEIEHERQYGHIQPGGVIEISGLRVLGIGVLDPLRLAVMPPASGTPAPVEQRRVWLDEVNGWGEAAIYRGADLAPGHALAGPLLVEEATTTLFAGPGDTLRIAETGDYLIDLGGRA